MSAATTSTTGMLKEETKASDNGVIVIGVAGGSGAGKTTLARSIHEAFADSNNIAYLIHDNYYKSQPHLTLEQRSKTNFDHPDSLDTNLLIQHIQDLKRGKTVQIPNYDFGTHLRTKEVTVQPPKRIVLVEGILIFSDPDLVRELDIKVFVDADSDIRLARRIARDVAERSRTSDQVLEQYLETVRPMHEEFVEPSKRVADLVVHSHNDVDPSIALSIIVNHLKVASGMLKI
jgi:uridine kinase